MGSDAVAKIGPEFAESFTDINGKQVHQFASQMANLGFARMTEALLGMLDSHVWQEFTDGLGVYRFLPGEFDYFLTQQGVARDHVMRGVADIEAKAQLEAAMDERRTGENGYRRRLAEVREQVPQRPGRPIDAFGYTQLEAKAHVNGSAVVDGARGKARESLGSAVRRHTNSGGTSPRRPSEQLPRWIQLRNRAERLPDEDLTSLLDALKAEQRRRRKAGAPP